MKILICLAMSCGLTAILYFYMKQRIFVIESRLNTLTELVQTIATEFYHKEKLNLENVHNIIPVGGSQSDEESDTSSESDSESGSESGSESSSDEECTEKMMVFEPVDIKIEPELEVVEVVEVPETNEPKIIPLLNEIVVDISEPIVVHKSENTVKLRFLTFDKSS